MNCAEGGVAHGLWCRRSRFRRRVAHGPGGIIQIGAELPVSSGLPKYRVYSIFGQRRDRATAPSGRCPHGCGWQRSQSENMCGCPSRALHRHSSTGTCLTFVSVCTQAALARRAREDQRRPAIWSRRSCVPMCRASASDLPQALALQAMSAAAHVFRDTPSPRRAPGARQPAPSCNSRRYLRRVRTCHGESRTRARLTCDEGLWSFEASSRPCLLRRLSSTCTRTPASWPLS